MLSRTRRTAPSVAIASLIALAGCTDPLSPVDRKLDQLITARSALLGADTLSPDRQFEPEEAYLTDSMDNESPESRNPDAAEIDVDAIDPLAEDRSAAARLTGFVNHALGTTVDPAGELPRPVMQLSLEGAFTQLQLTGRDYLTAEESYLFAAINLLQTRHLFNTRFFNDTQVQLSGFGDEGRFQHAVEILNDLRLTRRLRGGVNLTASWLTAATEQLRDVATDRWVQSSSIVLGADIPLLQGAGPTADEDIISAERNVVFAARTFERTRRQLLVSTAATYFSLLQAQANIEAQIRQVESLQNLLDQTVAEVEAGRTQSFQIGIAESQVLGAQSGLASLQENYVFALDNFKIQLGIPIETPLEILPLDFEIEVPDITMRTAVDAAIAYRLDLQNARDGVDDQRRAIRNARNAILPEFDITGSLTIPTDDGSGLEDDDTGGFDVDGEELNYTLSGVFSLPLDRRIERLELRDQMILFQRVVRNYYEFRDGVIVDARDAVRNVDLARFALELAERQVEINEQRQEAQRLNPGDVTTQQIVDTQTDLINAQNDRNEAEADLRNAILDFLLTTGQLRVAQDGTLLPPPGLVPEPGDNEPLVPLDPNDPDDGG
ncbi:MAG: TolC family protein [Planctomycetota bacterium]